MASLVDAVGLHPVEFFQEALEGGSTRPAPQKRHPIQIGAAVAWHSNAAGSGDDLESWLTRLDWLTISSCVFTKDFIPTSDAI